MNTNETDFGNTTPEYYFSAPGPYARPRPLSEDQPRHTFQFDEAGHIHVKNLSAWWIPELTITEEVGGTVYTVTGSYEGTQTFLRKLERITAQNFVRGMEESE